VTAARELMADETVLSDAEKIPAMKNPARPGGIFTKTSYDHFAFVHRKLGPYSQHIILFNFIHILNISPVT
jgi:hypothetical protein